MKKIIAVITLVVIGQTLCSQNLISNPSFEEVHEIVSRWPGTYIAFNKRIKHWTSPTQGSPDVLYVRHLDKMFPPRPKVDLSSHRPRTGKFMVGIKTYGCGSSKAHCKEYLQMKLKTPLQAGKKYFFEYWVCPIQTSVKVNSFGLTLSTTHTLQLSKLELNNYTPVHSNDELIDSMAWHRVSGTFEADSSYTHIIIGNFSTPKTLKYKIEPDGLDYGYYLLDDVTLSPVDSTGLPLLVPDKIMVLEDILFEYNKAILQESSKPQLNELAEYLKANQQYHINIMGHTDSIGGKAYNLKLSEDRALSIKEYLLQQGIQEPRITSVGKGSDFPLVPNDSEENRKTNRRVEIKISEE
jgi:OOP family OmpA-OmpF porin